jgi:hypothetical protein
MNQELMDTAEQAHQKLVSEVYVGHTGQLDPWTMELLKIFTVLVEAREREACAKVCVGISEKSVWEFENEIEAIEECVAAIRARGK